MLKENQEQDTAIINSLTHDGKGVSTLNGKKIFISGALLNETVSYEITRKKRHYLEAKAIEIQSPSEHRVTPPCEHFGICGGCSLQHLAMNAQIALKEEILLSQLLHIGKVIPKTILAPLTGKTEGYRRKARLGVKYVIKKNKLLVGFREKSSHYLADLKNCEILHERVGKHLQKLAEVIESLSITMQIPQIEVAMGDLEVALVFRHLQPLSIYDQHQLIEFAKLNSFILYSQPNKPDPIKKLWPDDCEYLKYSLPDFNLSFLFHPLDFTQINLEINRLMVKHAILELELNENEIVLDLFCGIGNFSLPIARFCKQVIGIEGSDEMVQRACLNAKLNQINNVNFQKADLTVADLTTVLQEKNFHKILLDPPREGAKNIIPFLKNCNAKRIIYISCNPATLARDAGEIVHEHGYSLQKVGVINMFPHTSHIEAIATFDKE